MNATVAVETAPRRASRRPLALGLAALLLLGLLAWVELRGGDSDSTAPQATDSAQLRELSASVGHAIYWAGAPEAGTELELTRSADGAVYVRYLSGDGELGDRRGRFTTVGTYPVPNAFAVLGRAAGQPTAVTRDLPGGGLALLDARRPQSVFLAWPGSGYEVEVFDPSPKRALDLVLDGAVIPVR